MSKHKLRTPPKFKKRRRKRGRKEGGVWGEGREEREKEEFR